MLYYLHERGANMKKSYEERAKLFIKQVYPFIRNCKTVEEYETAVHMFNRTYHRAVKVNHGQTRIVLMTSDYVVKLDYGDRQIIWGGCKNEYAIYKLAVKEGFDYLFAKITPIHMGRRYAYVMPFVPRVGTSSCDVEYKLKKKERAWVKKHCWDIHYGNYGWVNHKPMIIDYACQC